MWVGVGWGGGMWEIGVYEWGVGIFEEMDFVRFINDQVIDGVMLFDVVEFMCFQRYLYLEVFRICLLKK